MRIARLAVCGAVVFAALGIVRPAGWQQPRTFKSATALVEVDAVVLDKDGNFVPGLKLDDMTLLENGKPQKIQQFFMVTNNLGQNPLDANALASEHADEAQYGAHRVFVMLFDEAHLANDSLMRVKKGAEAFIRDMIHEGDAGGVFLNGGMFKGRLTIDKGELLAGVRAVQPAFENRQAILKPFVAWPRISTEVEAARIADGAREVTDRLGIKACQEDPASCASEGGLGNVENLIQQKARLYVRQARMMTQRTLQNLETVAKGLAKIPGRKTVVFMSEGFYVEDSRSALNAVSAQAARSGITFYSIDGRGLINSMSVNPDAAQRERNRSAAFDTGEDGPNILTQNTGGFMVRNVDDISRAFGLIVRDTSTYYVIGYQPENPTMDGKVRKIEVKTSMPGVKVRARKSYAAVPLPPQEAIWGFGK
ncbi:MAG: VWA domain-containing protein [Vicinamibacterales bacterium]